MLGINKITSNGANKTHTRLFYIRKIFRRNEPQKTPKLKKILRKSPASNT